MPRVYAYPAPQSDAQVGGHPLERNTSLYLQCCFVYEYMRMPLEQYLKTASRYEQRLGMKWYHLRLLKDAYANASREQRAKFPS